MRIKTMMLAAGFALAMPLTASAGDDKGKDIAKALNLDSTRSQQVEEIMENYHDQHERLKDQKEEQLDAILTDDEMDRLKKMKKDRKHDKKYDKKDR